MLTFLAILKWMFRIGGLLSILAIPLRIVKIKKQGTTAEDISSIVDSIGCVAIGILTFIIKDPTWAHWGFMISGILSILRGGVALGKESKVSSAAVPLVFGIVLEVLAFTVFSMARMTALA